VEQTQQWERVKELFAAALECDAAAREDFLVRQCAGNTSLRAEVESLLSAHACSDGLSRGPVTDLLPEAQPSQVIGPYTLIRKIGEGGMGQVWLAEQTEPLCRQVALKLLRPSLFDDSLLRRFQSERQSLAVMEHPAIAKVFDAGMTDDGQPYIVMELLPGEPITRYCDERKLGIAARLELFAKVCDGVQHAHQKAVIHRDLKPANILVVEVDGEPTPRIIDFGLAGTVQRGSSGEDTQAALQPLGGTPGYMSPEQARGDDLDTRTDVYSLGIVLYELLAGQLPFDKKDGHRAPSLPAPLPSTKAAEESQEAKIAATNRGLKPKQLARALRGDLDAIAVHALEIDRSRRYASPSELAADIRRHLRFLPVEALGAGSLYHLSKYVRRHRLAAVAVSVVVVLVAGASIMEAISLRRIARERDRAARIMDFMIRSFRVSDPSEARGNQVTAREILDNASDRIGSELSRDPEDQADMLMAMGAVYENLGLYTRAESLYRQAAANREQHLGPENGETLKAKAALGWALYRRGRYSDSETLLRQVLEVRQRRFGSQDKDTIAVMDQLGAVQTDEGHPKEGEALERQALAFRRRAFGDANSETLISMNHLALALLNQGRWREAEDLDRPLLDGWSRLEGSDSPHSLSAADNLAIVLYREGRLTEAESLERSTIQTKKRVLGPEHPETVRSINTLTAILVDEGKLEEAQSLSEQVLAIRRRVLGPEHHLTLSTMSNLAEILTRRGDFKRAEELLINARSTEARVLGPDHPATATATYNLGCLVLREGHRDQALSLLREAIDHGLPAWIVASMPKDPDLAQLGGDPKFDALLAYANQRDAKSAR
jgi:eukaryotic-like serine/threonine-protein kinase